jgi:hypothetical protein
MMPSVRDCFEAALVGAAPADRLATKPGEHAAKPG